MTVITYLAVGSITLFLVVVGLIAISIAAIFLLAIVFLSISLITLERVAERVAKISRKSPIRRDQGNARSPF